MKLKKYLLETSRRNKKILALMSDFISICLATILALVIVNIELSSLTIYQILNFLWVPLLSLITFWYTGVYRSVVRYLDLSVISVLTQAILLSLLIVVLLKFLYQDIALRFFSVTANPLISFEGWLVGSITFFFLVISSRFTAHFFLSNRRSEKRVVIYGAGSAGIQLASALRVSTEMQPIAFVDSNSSLHGTYLGGIKVLHPKKLERLSHKRKVDEVLIAMPSASKSTLTNLLKEIEKYSVKVRILPGLAELAEGKILVSELKEVDISNLLGRSEVEADQDLINRNIADKVVLITGAGGSIGSEISRQVSRNKVKKLILLDSSEYALYSIKSEIESLSPEVELHSVLANVTNEHKITQIFKTFSVDTVYHAAAYKHVPLVEQNPYEGIFNNIIGTRSCVNAAIKAEVETFVLISTDKAVRPTNIMGATKRFAEMILQSLSDLESVNSKTRMTMVRFGNVIGSSGSAIPLFQQQIKNGGPVTVTDSNVTRYFMSVSEAAELVIQAGAMGKGGDVFVLDMGEPIKIFDLAKRLINLSGMELRDKNNPEGDIEIIFTALRPGEKLYEELLIGDNVSATEHKRILRAEEDFLPADDIDHYINLLIEAGNNGDINSLREVLQKVVSGYTPEDKIVDILYQQNSAN